VSASNVLGGTLSARRYIYVFPVIRRSKWVIVDLSDTTSLLDKRGTRRALADLRRTDQWRTVYSAASIRVLRRR
jgi:hypothetical protein